METDDLVFACASNIAGWHDVWLRALGLPTERDESVWWAPQGGPPIYLGAITLRPGVETVPAVNLPVCDSWDDLVQLERVREEHWFVRPPGPLDLTAPGLAIERATTAEMEEFEAASLRGFEAPAAAPGSIHAAAALDDDHLVVWLGRVGGEVVTSATSYVDDRCVGVYAVATLPEARGRGYGAAITARAAMPELGLPAMLTPSPLAVPMYERLGFREIARYSHRLMR